MVSKQVLAGDRRALARAISILEDQLPSADALARDIFSRTGRAWRIGMTGPPGSGKSTLVDRLTATLRRRGQTVGVLAVDPTSPFSGGAILGDRIRMQDHAADPGVFIRSMATRGHLGGLAEATDGAALVLDAAGFDVIVIETVGVGQAEVEIVRSADVCVVTVVPESGDDVQALKAGIMEIADVFVVNKADHDGADRAVATVEAMLALKPTTGGEWRPPVLKTVATAGTGVADLLGEIDRCHAHLLGVGQSRRRLRAESHLRRLLEHRFSRYVESRVLTRGELERLVGEIEARRLDPYTAAEEILGRVLGPGHDGRSVGRSEP